MANEYFDAGAVPPPSSPGSSAVIRNEYEAVEKGFDKLPAMLGHEKKVIQVNATGDGLIASDYEIDELAKQSRPTGSLKMPAGSNLQRDPSPQEGWTRFNLETLSLEIFVSGVWGAIAGAQGPQGPTGAAGPTGPTGQTGPQGPQGITGSQGQAGTSTIIRGSFGASRVPADLPINGFIPANWDAPGVPASDIQYIVGESMHFTGPSGAGYSTGDLYVFLGAALPEAWENVGNVRGPQGAQGVQGTQGVQGPAGTNGSNGAAGPIGVQGPIGPAGPAGTTGATGLQGDAGSTGPQGPQGAEGRTTIIKGDFGASKVPADLPVNGFIPADWDEPGSPVADMQLLVGDSLIYHGPPGSGYDTGDLFVFVAAGTSTGWDDIGQIVGPAGAQGPIGPTGPQGPAGTNGLNGATGVQGSQGPQGSTGPTGLTGSPGPQGQQGPQGIQGPTGSTTIIRGDFGVSKTPPDLPVNGFIPANWDAPGSPATSTQMNVGDSLIYQGASGSGYNTGDLYVFIDTADPTGWADVGQIVGPAGPTGPQGPQGIQGATGAAGAPGAQGAQGVQGPQGPAGPAGAVGMVWRGPWATGTVYNANDAVSNAGSSWIVLVGHTSSTAPVNGAIYQTLAQAGATGAQGPEGPQGAQGVQGIQGPTGPAGASTAAGVSFTPVGSIAANNVQAALQEVDSEKVPLGGAGATGTWGISVSGSSASCTGNAATATAPAGGGTFITSANIASQAVASAAVATYSKQVPASGTTGTLVAADTGKCVSLNAAIIVPANVFVAGDVVSLQNNVVGNLTITQGAGLTLYQAGVIASGNRTLSQQGIATIWFLSPTVCYISGSGVT